MIPIGLFWCGVICSICLFRNFVIRMCRDILQSDYPSHPPYPRKSCYLYLQYYFLSSPTAPLPLPSLVYRSTSTTPSLPYPAFFPRVHRIRSAAARTSHSLAWPAIGGYSLSPRTTLLPSSPIQEHHSSFGTGSITLGMWLPQPHQDFFSIAERHTG